MLLCVLHLKLSGLWNGTRVGRTVVLRVQHLRLLLNRVVQVPPPPRHERRQRRLLALQRVDLHVAHPRVLTRVPGRRLPLTEDVEEVPAAPGRDGRREVALLALPQTPPPAAPIQTTDAALQLRVDAPVDAPRTIERVPAERNPDSLCLKLREGADS
jgi:hypothetical protein